MKASTLIGLPIVLLLGSFWPTWHLVNTSNILLLTCYSTVLFNAELAILVRINAIMHPLGASPQICQPPPPPPVTFFHNSHAAYNYQ